MHVGIFGPTRCGKTTLARTLADQYLRRNRAILVCDPIPQKWPQARWQTNNAAALLEMAQKCRNCAIFIEEASVSIARDRDLSWLFTTAGNPAAGGHLVHVIGQDGSSLLPGMRQQLSTIFLFRCHPDLAQIWARQFAQPEIATEAPTLARYEFLIAKAFEPLRRCQLHQPNQTAAPTGAGAAQNSGDSTAANAAPSP